MKKYLTYEIGFWVLLLVVVVGGMSLVHHNHEEWQAGQIRELQAVVSQQNVIQQQIVQYLNAHPIK